MKKPTRVHKAWSTRPKVAEELDRIAEKFALRWEYTLDRSKLINIFCSALFKAESCLEESDMHVINEDTLEEMIVSAICKSRLQKKLLP